MFIVYGHCASGAREVWDTANDLDKAKAIGVKALADYPVTDCGTGGVVWVEIIGSPQNGPPLPDAVDGPEWEAWITWEPDPETEIMIGLERGDNGVWQSA